MTVPAPQGSGEKPMCHIQRGHVESLELVWARSSVAWVYIWVLPLVDCVALGRLLNISECYLANICSSYLLELLQELMT